MQSDGTLEGTDSVALLNAQEFLELVGDDDLLRFLRRLPMIAGNEDTPVTLRDLMYEMMLWPYVKSAWATVKGSPGVAGRILQMSRVYKTAEAELTKETGLKRRVPRVIDLPTFINIYSTEGLP